MGTDTEVATIAVAERLNQHHHPFAARVHRRELPRASHSPDGIPPPLSACDPVQWHPGNALPTRTGRFLAFRPAAGRPLEHLLEYAHVGLRADGALPSAEPSVSAQAFPALIGLSCVFTKQHCRTTSWTCRAGRAGRADLSDRRAGRL